MPPTPRRRDRALLVATLAVAGCAPPLRPGDRAATPTAAVGLPAEAYPGYVPDMSPTVAYPPPAPAATPTRDPDSWAPGEVEAEIRAALPPGAEPDLEHEDAWGSRPGRTELYGVAYTLDGRPSVAAVTVRPPGLVWDLRRDGPADLAATGAWPLQVTSSNGRASTPAVAVATDGGAWLLVLSLEGEPGVAERLALPDTVRPQGLRGYHLPMAERDLTGDGRADLALGLRGEDDRRGTVLYRRLGDGSLRLVEVVEPGSLVLDLDRDGQLEIVVPQGGESWVVRRWSGDAYAPAETLAEPSPRSPQPIADGSLPPLPGEITFRRDGEGAVWRWPREGGALRALWRAEDGGPGLRGVEVSADGRRVVYALQDPKPRKPSAPVFLALQDVATGEDLGAPRRVASGHEQDLRHGLDLRGFDLSADGGRLVYVAFGIGADARPLPTPDSARRSGEQGTVFVVDAADPSRAEPVGPCAALGVDKDWVLDCLGEVSLTADGNQVAWADARGLWVAALPGGAPRRLVAHFIPENEVGLRVYWPDRWSPAGRHLLVHVGFYEGSAWAVIDVATGVPVDVPDAFSGHVTRAEVSWSPDGAALLVARWQGEAALRLVDVSDPSAARPLWGDTLALSSEAHQHAIGPAIAPDGSLRFALRHTEAEIWRGNGVYRAAPDGSDVVRLAHLPPVVGEDELDQDPGTLTWSPDGAAFLVRYAEDGAPRALVGLADGSALWDATAVLADAEWAAWSR